MTRWHQANQILVSAEIEIILAIYCYVPQNLVAYNYKHYVMVSVK